MKIYPKTFENVFSEDSCRKFDFSEISIKNSNVDEYVKIFKNLLKDFSSDLFDFYVKVTWLKNKFAYRGRSIDTKGLTGGGLDAIFTRFLRRIIGNDTQFFTRDFLYPKVNSYFKDFFSDFNDGNPFENPDFYKFPFKNITIEFLSVVYQMDDRIELLKFADKKKMAYAKFLDFIINQIYSINEELGYNKYIFIKSNKCQSYIKDTEKKLLLVKGAKKRNKFI